MREVVPFVLLACACAAAAERPAEPRVEPVAPVATASAEAPIVDVYDDLVAQGAAVAPGMRVSAERAGAGEPVELVRAEGGDVCMRAVFASSAPATASLVSSSGEVLAAVEGAATEGVLPLKGPVCVRRGDAVRGSATGGGRVRWVAWVGAP